MGFSENPLLDFQNSRWRGSASLKIVKSPISTKNHPILMKQWYTNADLELNDSQVTKYKKNKIQDGGRPPF